MRKRFPDRDNYHRDDDRLDGCGFQYEHDGHGTVPLPHESSCTQGNPHQGPTRYKHDEVQKLLARTDDRSSDSKPAGRGI
jgi:hypothetical protein